MSPYAHEPADDRTTLPALGVAISDMWRHTHVNPYNLSGFSFIGGFYRDETINEGGYYGCTLGGGTSSSGVYL